MRTRTTRGRTRPGAFSGRGFLLGRISGIELVVDWSLIIIFTLIALHLGLALFPFWHPDWGPLLTWTVAISAAILFFVSVLAHELSHALVGRVYGIPVPRITLFVFGGMAHMEKDASSPKGEFLMAIVGPLTSIAIGLGAILAGAAIVPDPEALARDPAGMAQLGPIPTLLFWLGPLNLLLGVFNMLPGFPLDGGRVLRAFLWWATGSVQKATRWAAGIGRGFGWGLMALGASMALGVVIPVLGGGLIQGLWLLLIGWFLSSAARASYGQMVVKHALEEVPVSEVMRARFEAVHPSLLVSDFVQDIVMSTDQRVFPVAVEDRLVGVVSLDDVRRIPHETWASRRIEEIMTPAERVPTVDVRQDASVAMQELIRDDVDQLPVLDHGRLTGIVRRQDILKWLTLRGEAAPI